MPNWSNPHKQVRKNVSRNPRKPRMAAKFWSNPQKQVRKRKKIVVMKQG